MTAALAGVSLMGCGEAGRGPEVVTRDSAGTTIVELSTRPEAPVPWVISPEPRVLIGGDTEDERAQLVRVTGAARRSDGRIVIADGGASEVRLFEADGAPVAAFGRQGGGPGEFAGMSFFHLLSGDSALVFDARNRRFTVVAPGMALGREYQPTQGGRPVVAMPVAMFPTGSAVARGAANFDDDLTTGVYDGAAPLVLLSADGAVRDTLGTFPQRSSFMRIGQGTIEIVRLPFGAETAFAVADRTLHLGTAHTLEILSFSDHGDLVRVLRVDAPVRAVTDEDIRRFTEAAAARVPEQARAGLRASYDEVPAPERMPAHGALIGDADGNLWVERYRPLPDEVPTWTVFAPDGRPLGTVETPGGVRLLEVGEDYILGSGADALDRPWVAIWDLERSPPTG